MEVAAFPSLFSLCKETLDVLVCGEMVSDESMSRVSDYDLLFDPLTQRTGYVLNRTRKQYRLCTEVGDAVKIIFAAYSSEGLKAHPSINIFCSPIYRLAYFYRFFTSHVYMMQRFFLESYCVCVAFRGAMDALFASRRIRLCAVGGGPATDILGLLCFLHAQRQYGSILQKLSIPICLQQPLCRSIHLDYSSRDSGPWNIRHIPPHLNFNFNFGRPLPNNYVFGSQANSNRKTGTPTTGLLSPPIQPQRAHYMNHSSPLITQTLPVIVQASVLDNCTEWKNMADTILRNFQRRTGNHVYVLDQVAYDCIDFADKSSLLRICNTSSDIANADVVTLVKVVSAMAGSGQRRRDTVESLEIVFDVMKCGGVVFYMDNSGGPYTQLVKEAANRSGLIEIYRAEHVPCEVPSYDVAQMLEPFKQYFHIGPQLRATVSVVILLKPTTKF